jgi:hypothetical protein
VLDDLKEVKVENWTSLVKGRKAWCELVQKTETHRGLWCQQKEKKASDTIRVKPLSRIYMSQLNGFYGRGVVFSFSKLEKSGIKLAKTVCDVHVIFWSICFSRLAVYHLRA